MVETQDAILGLAGFAMSFYGGFLNNQLLVVSGILLIILTITFRLSEQEDDIKTLKAQINTKSELNRIWREIDELRKSEKKRK